MHQIITITHDASYQKFKKPYTDFLKQSGINKTDIHYLTADKLNVFRAELFLRKNNPFIQFTPLIISVNMFSFLSKELKEKVLNLILQFSKLDNVFVLNLFFEKNNKDFQPHNVESSRFLESISVKTVNVDELATLKIETKEGKEHSFLDLRRGVLRNEIPLQIADLIHLVEEGIISKKNDLGLLSMVSSRNREEILIELKEKKLIVDLIRGECA